jgi:hypothetical protein
MLKRILLVIQSSPQMQSAADLACKLASDSKSQLLLFPLSDKSAAKSEQGVGERVLSSILRQVETEGIAFELLSTDPLPFSRGMEWARSSDLVVLPHDSAERSGRFAKRLVRLLTSGGTPVMLPGGESRESKTVAVAWDGSGAAARALKLHLQLFHRPHYRYLLITVGDDPERAQSILDLGGALIEAHGPSAEMLALSGKAADRIKEIAATVDFDHLILAPHLGRSDEGKNLGSTSRKIMKMRSTRLFIA